MTSFDSLAVQSTDDAAPLTLAGSMTTSMLPAAAGQIVLLGWVPESRIPAAHRVYVKRHVKRAALMLGLSGVRVRYFGPPIPRADFFLRARYSDALPAGTTPDDQPNTVAINAALRGQAVPAVVSHELRHLAQLAAQPEYAASRQAVAAEVRGSEGVILSGPTIPLRGLELEDMEADADLFAARYMRMLEEERT